ncbi:MAG TPA: glycosyltransferase family 9 protein [Thermoanaerobaculia bacterium]|nr:glycosyltransferase family 9 protein [Thermoanaerobaculia bacterium]
MSGLVAAATADAPAPRILLVRTSALGDVVHCLPVLTALARHLPRARIAWVVERGIAPLLAGHPLLERVIPVGLRPWRRAPLAAATRREVAAARRELKAFAADVAIDLMGNHKGALLARLSGARRVVGAAREWRREPSSALWIGEPVPAPPGAAALHAVDRALALATAVGVPDGAAAAGAGRPGGPADFGGELLLPSARPAAGAEPYLLIHPGAGWGNKVYPPERWGGVAHRLAGTTGLPVRVPAAPGEEALATAVAAASGGAARVVPGGDLADLVRELRGARLVLAGDTGPLHLAWALGVPVLAVHGPTDPALHGPHGAPERAVFERLPCSFCYKRFSETKACLLVVTPDRVAERAEALLAGSSA